MGPQKKKFVKHCSKVILLVYDSLVCLTVLSTFLLLHVSDLILVSMNNIPWLRRRLFHLLTTRQRVPPQCVKHAAAA